MIQDPRCDDDLLRAPDPDAIAAFYARHARAVEAFFARRTGDRARACWPRSTRLDSREIAVDWGVAGEGDHMTVSAGGGHAGLEFKLAGSARSASQVGPDATAWRMRVAARERRASEFVPRHWPGSQHRRLSARRTRPRPRSPSGSSR